MVQCAYDEYGTFAVAGDTHDTPEMPLDRKGLYIGNAFRVDLLTTDDRGVIACYGDSITAGAKSTPGSGHRYPELLAGLLDQPTLNLGVNGDLARHSRGAPALIDELEGVTTVIYLMGINDIIKNAMNSPEDYIKTVTDIVEKVQKSERKIYLGALMPASGWKDFDEQKDALRRTINAWIRSEAKADGIIDFDEALRDPASPS